MILVVIESPFKGETPEIHERNLRYLKACMLDSLSRGEAPFASHMLYTQVLNDHIPEERALGIRAGLAWGTRADTTAVYTNLGVSPGMQIGIDHALREGREVVYRVIPGWIP